MASFEKELSKRSNEERMKEINKMLEAMQIKIKEDYQEKLEATRELLKAEGLEFPWTDKLDYASVTEWTEKLEGWVKLFKDFKHPELVAGKKKIIDEEGYEREASGMLFRGYLIGRGTWSCEGPTKCYGTFF